MYSPLGYSALQNCMKRNPVPTPGPGQSGCEDDEICKSLRDFADMILSDEDKLVNKENYWGFCNYQRHFNPNSVFGLPEQDLAVGRSPHFTKQNNVDNRNLKPHNKNQRELNKNRGRSSSASSQKSKNNWKYCVFCVNNNESESVARSHSIRDKFGNVLCPKLRVYVCPICNESGDNAHTLKYCPKKGIVTMEETFVKERERDLKTNRCRI